MKHSPYALLTALSLAACGEAAQQAQEPGAAGPDAPVREAGMQPESTLVGVPSADVGPGAVSPSETTPGTVAESYESCMARVNHGGDGGASSDSCAHLADAPR